MPAESAIENRPRKRSTTKAVIGVKQPRNNVTSAGCQTCDAVALTSLANSWPPMKPIDINRKIEIV